MATNSRRVLDMLAEGKITAEEAQKLLDRLVALGDTGADESEFPAVPSDGAQAPAADPPVPENPKFLRVRVEEKDGDRVDVRVPIALIRTGLRFAAIVPHDAREHMEQHGLDLSALSELDSDELVKALAALTVDVEEKDGGRVRVFCE